jgi:solute carrier family 25 protein 42
VEGQHDEHIKSFYLLCHRNLSITKDFSVFDFMRHKFYNPQEKTNRQKLILFGCGATAGACSVTATTPFEFVRLRLAMEKDNFTYPSALQVFKKVYVVEGFLGFYRGFLASLCGIVIYHGFSFFIFTSAKNWIREYDPQDFRKWYVDFLSGGLSSIGQVFGYPIDIIRKRMQAQYLLFQKKEIPRVQNYKELISDIWKKEGILKGFYKGISLNALKGPLAISTAWTVKNKLNRLMDQTYDL